MKSILNIGGDRRQIYLMEMLEKEGYMVYTGDYHKHINSVDIILLPTPMSRSDINTDMLKCLLSPSHMVIGGGFSEEFTNYFLDKNIEYHDLLKDPHVLEENAIATAEGAIAYAITKSIVNISESKCLVLGHGRCAKAIIHILKGMDSDVMLADRKNIPFIKEYIGRQKFIFNTIPACILNSDSLELLDTECTIIDIASAPGGLDYNYVREKDLNAHLCLGIPGTISPKSAGITLAKSAIKFLKERSD